MRTSFLIFSFILVFVSVNAQTAQDYYKIASSKYNDKEYAAAAVDYTRAIDLQSESAVLYNNRGLCYAKIEQWDKAEEDFTTALELDPDYKQSYLNLGNMHLDKRTYDKAVLAYNNAIQLDTNYYVVYAKRAYTSFYLADYKGALRDYTKAIEYEPSDYVLYNARGAVYQKLGEIQNAIADYNKTLSLNPKAYETFINRGILRTQLRQYDDAISDFTVAQSFAGMSGEGYYYRGLCRVGQLDAIRTSKEKHLVMDIKANNKLLELACSDFKKAKEFSFGRAFESYQEYCVESKTKDIVTKVDVLDSIIPIETKEIVIEKNEIRSLDQKADWDKLKAELKAEIIAELVKEYNLVPREQQGDSLLEGVAAFNKIDTDTVKLGKQKLIDSAGAVSLVKSKYRTEFSNDIMKSRYYDSAWRAVLKSFDGCNFDEMAFKDSPSIAYKYATCLSGVAQAIGDFRDSVQRIDIFYQETGESLIFGFRQDILFGNPNGETNDVSFAMGDTLNYPEDKRTEVVSVFDNEKLVYQFNPSQLSYSYEEILGKFHGTQLVIEE